MFTFFYRNSVLFYQIRKFQFSKYKIMRVGRVQNLFIAGYLLGSIDIFKKLIAKWINMARKIDASNRKTVTNLLVGLPKNILQFLGHLQVKLN